MRRPQYQQLLDPHRENSIMIVQATYLSLATARAYIPCFAAIHGIAIHLDRTIVMGRQLL